MGDWRNCTLGDLITFQRGHDLPKEKMTGKGYPVVGSNGIIGYHEDYTTESPSITVGRSGNVGNPFIIYGKTWSHNTTLYVKEFRDVDPVFIYYYLKTLPLANYAGGSAVPTLNRNHIHTLEVSVPVEINEQEKIGSTLKTIDDKIEANRTINDNLEQQAMALFKAWFVDYSPFQGHMPSNWKEYKLGDFLPVITGKKNANVSSDHGKYPFFSCSQDIAWTDEYSFEGDAILVAGNGDFNVKFFSGKFEAYQRTYVLIPHNPRFTAWLFYAVKHNLDLITIAARGSVIKFITKGNLEDFAFHAPVDLDNCAIIDHFTAINNQIATNRSENARLSEIIDSLLPRLMSGELDVSELDL